MFGLGDNVYQRAFISQLKGNIELVTPWPQLYSDLPNVKLLKPETHLRTQLKNMKSLPDSAWHGPLKLGGVKNGYGNAGIMMGMSQRIGCNPGVMTLPPLPEPIIDGDYILVRPVTVRSEWNAESRNPLPEYVNQAAESLYSDYKIVSVADLSDGEEWLVGGEPVSHIKYHKGELSVLELLSLAANAKAVIGGVGWIVPVGIASGVPTLAIMGGNGGYNSPDKLVNPAQDCSHVTFLKPDKFCTCTEKAHNCDKSISNFTAKLREWRTKEGI